MMSSEAGDTSNFSTYPDSEEESPPVSKTDDPFLDWWLHILFSNLITLDSSLFFN